MIPIPQYSLYSDTLSLYNAYSMEYYLDEDNYWQLNQNELQRSFDKAKDQCIPRAIVIINPGNPTGQILSKENIEMIIKFGKTIILRRFENQIIYFSLSKSFIYHSR